MNLNLKEAGKFLLKKSLQPAALRLTRHQPRILMYHRFGSAAVRGDTSVAVLEEQLAYLSRHFTVVPLLTIVERLRAGKPLDAGLAAITVDDAYADFFTHAYPLFQQYKAPVTLFVVTRFADGDYWFWWDKIRYLLDRAQSGTYVAYSDKHTVSVSLTDDGSRIQAWHNLGAVGLQMTPEQRVHYVDALMNTFQLQLPSLPPPEYAGMSWEQLSALDPTLVEIGAHTCTHPILSRCTAEQIEFEIFESKRVIEARLQRPVKSFCYPNGQAADVDERCIAAAEKAGYDNAVLAYGGFVNSDSRLFTLQRLAASNERSYFAGEVSGVSFLNRQLRTRIAALSR